jgi:hypothetical protein
LRTVAITIFWWKLFLLLAAIGERTNCYRVYPFRSRHTIAFNLLPRLAIHLLLDNHVVRSVLKVPFVVGDKTPVLTVCPAIVAESVALATGTSKAGVATSLYNQ